MKNFAFLYSGKPNKLKSLPHNCSAVHEILERHNEWKVLVNRSLESEKKLREDFEKHQNLEIENLLVFYTGHGEPYSEDGKIRNKLKLCLVDDNYDVQVLLNSIFDSFNPLPKRVAIVLDACYSGKFIYDATRFSNGIEILTSSLPHLTSSEENKLSRLSLFSHYFCEAIEQLSFQNEVVTIQHPHPRDRIG